MLEKGALYVVGTPIGNLGDFSPRAREVLGEVDFIAAEDTRVTRGLLTHFDIHKPLISFFEHNKVDRGERILARLAGGESAALVSDAGMPAISDPGETLVAGCAERGIPVYVVPGPTVVSALAVSGLPTGRFTFEGFLSVNKRSRREHLAAVEGEERTMVFYEAPHKLRRTLGDFAKTFGQDRRVAVVRELTKVHEEVWRTTLGEAAARYREQEPRGEYVLVIAGAQPVPQEEGAQGPEEAVEIAKGWMEKGVSASEAAKEAAKATGVRKGEIYKLLMEG